MFKDESEFKKIVNRLKIDTEPNPEHRENLRRQMLSVFNKTSQKQKTGTAMTDIWRIIMNNRITKLAVAAVIAIILLVPLSYGTGHLIKKLFVGSVEIDDYQGDFALSKDIRIELEVGTKEQQNIVSARNIRFFVEDDELRGTLRCWIRCLPKYKWMTTIELLDTKNKKLASTEHVNENAGVEVSYKNSSPRDIHFSFRRWSNVSQAQKFRVCFEKASEDIETTPDAWVDTSELYVVHGRVTGPGGKPIANSVIQIRQKGSGTAPNVTTDQRGFYSYDSIKWPYSVGAIVYESYASSQDHKHQYKRLNKYLEGSQTVNFEFDEFPTGDAALFGQVESPTSGQTIREFSVDIRLAVDFEDYSPEYLYQFGLRKPFTTEDGRFEISNLPAGVYDVTIYPTQNDEITEYIRRMSYVCELQEGQKIEIGAENARKKTWYGRVLFEDGSAAVSKLEGFETQVIYWHQDSTWGFTLATVDDNGYFDNGYFATQISDEVMEYFKSGQAWLKVSLTKPDIIHEVQKEGEKYPVELLSLERDKAGVLKIKRPDIYYGRILYENGKPAVPEVFPWPDAKVRVILRYTPASSKARGVMLHPTGVDNEGYFATYFTDKEIEQLKTGEYSIEIYHPSYLEMNESYPVISYPFEKLSTEKESVKGYKMSFKSQEFENLRQVLESIEKLKGLFAALKTYANSHQGNYPGTIGLLDIKADDFQWLAENVEYIGDAKAQTTSKPAETVLAYDKALLEKYGSTLVLFRDGHIEFCWPRHLEILGILRTDIEVLH